ncbi:MAG TPA: hypothetical protein VGX68_07900 [Thermoanaerobaculia bacterium]|jgi:hypothetical protein|nr:hypothetical protein [Thermoanaerobaculia bacterium]
MPTKRSIAGVAVVALMVSTAFAAGWLVGDRGGVEHVGPAEFVEREDLIGSIQDAEFLGVAYDRAYLYEWSYWPIIGERTRFLWTEAGGLPPGVLRKLEAKEAQAVAAVRRPRP